MLRPFADRHSETETESHPSLVDLLGSLMRQIADLVRDEIALAKSELQDRLRVFRRALSITIIGILLALLASMAMVSALIIALAPHLGAALSAVIVGSALGVVSTFLLARGLRQFRRLE